mgnify:CR=1 FL=1
MGDLQAVAAGVAVMHPEKALDGDGVAGFVRVGIVQVQAQGLILPLTALNRAAGTGDYYHATEKYHSLNYGEYARVQEHAEPLYRISQEITAPPDYFILEITWTEVDEKETDLIYLLATQA